ncbi:MAG: acid-shock protein, partial [Mesorhizobium sp.]
MIRRSILAALSLLTTAALAQTATQPPP